jgi:hypothetical protein
MMEYSRIHFGEQQSKQNLQRWIVDWSEKPTPQGVLSLLERPKTARSTLQVDSISVSQVLKCIEKIPPGPKMEHRLPKWTTNRPESSLESSTSSLAHWEHREWSRLADTLNYGGVMT